MLPITLWFQTLALMGTISLLRSSREMGLQRCCWTPRGWDNDKPRGGGSLDRYGSLSCCTSAQMTWELLLHHVPIGTLEVAIHTSCQASRKPFKHIYFLLLVLCGQMGILKLHRMETVKNNSQSVCSGRNCWVKKDYFYSVVCLDKIEIDCP